jgi:DNA-binding transcriptional LysR family regulator
MQSAQRSRKSGPSGRLRWDDARVLLALLAARSLLGAGQRLGLNASTVSRRLDALERALGARLFDRTPDGVLPTALAEQLGPHAEGMERAAIGLALAAEGREASPEGEVRLTAPPGYAEHMLAPAMPRLLAQHPKLRVVIDAGTHVADLSRREADLAVRSARPSTGDLVAKRLGAVVPGLLASPRYAARLGTLTRLADARWITWGPDLAHIPPARLVTENVPPEAIVLRTSHLGTQLAAAEAGLGVLLLDRNIARVRKLVVLETSPELARALSREPAEMWLLGHRALRDVPRIAAVWDFLVAEAARWSVRRA